MRSFPASQSRDATASLVCPVCDATDQDPIVVPHPLYRHLDFREIHPGPGILGRCQRCQLVWRDPRTVTLAVGDAVFRSDAYAQHQESHTVVVDGFDGPVTRTHLQARLVAPLLPRTGGAVLDIGCFDGQLLRELGGCCTADLHGYDVCEPSDFPKGNRFRFVRGRLSDVDGAFDVIVMSHAMQYVRDVRGLFDQIGRLLKPDGALFVQAPNFSVKPCTLLLGDQHYHYTPHILANLIRSMGFDYTCLSNAWFPREIVATAISAPDVRTVTFEPDRDLFTCLDQVTTTADRLMALEERSVGVLGTTIEAAFADSVLGARVVYFVDENPGKVGTTFHEKPVVHPRFVGTRDHIVIAMGTSGAAISRRLTALYPGTFISV